jgi:site-specific recombinase XerD
MRIRNFSERTIATYLSLLNKLIAHYGLPFSQLTLNKLKDYIYYRIRVDKISVSTVNQIISAWKIVHVYILGKEWEECKIKRPRLAIKLPEVLSKSEAKAIVSSPRNIKHHVILNLMYSTGIRLNELLSLKIGDVDSKRMIIKVKQGKGKKERHVILHPYVLGLLRNYYKHYRPRVYLIEGHVAGSPYSAESIRKIIKASTRKVGVKKTVSPHTLRHSFATHMLEKGVNLKIIQQLLGHSSIITTSRYLHLANISENNLPNPLD